MNFEDYTLNDPEEDCNNMFYEGVEEPECNKGLGCVACWEVYFTADEKRREKRNSCSLIGQALVS